MGPSEFILGQGMDVRPHPHIGLSTVTYLFDGEIMHRDSLGTELSIRPGELNWMTAGRGITHSERTSVEVRASGSKLFGLQSWVALSAKDEENAPAFEHYDKADLPTLTGEGKTVRVIAGSVFGTTSPVHVSNPMFYADVDLTAGSSVPLDVDHEERAIFTIHGEIEIAGDVFEPGRLLIFKPGDRVPRRRPRCRRCRPAQASRPGSAPSRSCSRHGHRRRRRSGWTRDRRRLSGCGAGRPRRPAQLPRPAAATGRPPPPFPPTGALPRTVASALVLSLPKA